MKRILAAGWRVMAVVPTRQAAGVAVFRPDGRLLLGLHAHDGRWATIGGAVEPGESHSDSARREVFEEVGLEVDTLHPLGVLSDSPLYDIAYPDGTIVTYAVTMFAAILEAVAEIEPDGREILDAVWVAPKDVERIELGLT